MLLYMTERNLSRGSGIFLVNGNRELYSPLGNTAQNPPDGFARNLRADFPSYCPKIPCNTTAFEAGFCPRTKECRTKINCDRQYACGISMQSAEKSDNAPYAQALCGVALKQYCPYISCEVFFAGTGSETFLFLEKRRTKCDCRTGGMERCCGIWHIRY